MGEMPNFQEWSMQVLVGACVLVAIWGFFRPSMVRDFGNRKLPFSVSARCHLALLYLLVFAVMVAAFHMLHIKLGIKNPLANLPEAGPYAAMQIQSPAFALLSFGGFQRLFSLGDIEKTVIVTLHSARHLRYDRDMLFEHLMTCSFEPSAIESEKNFQSLRRNGVFVKPGEKWNYQDMVSVGNWRKVSSLLRLLQDWQPTLEGVLDQSEIESIDEMVTSHDRKTNLAATIVKMREMGAEGRKTPAALSEAMRQLSSAPQLDRERVAFAEAAVLQSASAGVAADTVRITSQDLHGHLQLIERYFETEYEILLERSARLVADAVTQAGDASSKRLEEVKRLGFSKLGSIERINFDKMLWLFLLAWLGGFVIMMIGFMGKLGSAIDPVDLVQFAFAMAIAALTGVVFGSIRNYATAPSPPWGAYIGAGIVAGLLFIAIFMVMDFVRYDLFRQELMAGKHRAMLSEMAAWAALPFVTSIAICIMGRQKRIPFFAKRYDGTVAESLIDGIAVSAALYFGFCLAIGLNHLFKIELGPVLKEHFAKYEGSWLSIPPFAEIQILGFVIGFFCCRVVGRAAHSTSVDLSPDEVKVGASHAPASAERVAEEPAGVPRSVAGMFSSATH